MRSCFLIFACCASFSAATSTTPSSLRGSRNAENNRRELQNNRFDVFAFDLGQVNTKRFAWKTIDGSTWTWNLISTGQVIQKYSRDSFDGNSVTLLALPDGGSIVRIDLGKEVVQSCNRQAPTQCSSDLILSAMPKSSPTAPTSAPITTPARDCSKKQVKIYNFLINGFEEGWDDPIGTAGEGEHQLKINDRRYFPTKPSDCKQTWDSKGFCSWEQKKLIHLENKAGWESLESHRGFRVGTEEDDIRIGGNVNYFVDVQHNEWFLETCETYAIQVSRSFKDPASRTACYKRTDKLEAFLKKSNNKQVQFCDPNPPADSFVWYMDVKSTAEN